MRSEADINKYIGRQLRHTRENAGLSQMDIGRTSGVSSQQVQKYEWAINRIAASKLYLLAEALGVPIAAFFPKREQNTSELVMPASVRFLKLLQQIPPNQYDRVYAAMQAIVEIAGATDDHG